jgi:hypothetical protein
LEDLDLANDLTTGNRIAAGIEFDGFATEQRRATAETRITEDARHDFVFS